MDNCCKGIDSIEYLNWKINMLNKDVEERDKDIRVLNKYLAKMTMNSYSLEQEHIYDNDKANRRMAKINEVIDYILEPSNKIRASKEVLQHLLDLVKQCY